jgi:hypothetical protein
MSNKKETPVSWLVEQFNLQAYAPHVEHALQVESQKNQKYDEMLAMLEKAEMYLREVSNNKFLANKTEQLVKEAKEL